MFFSLYFYSSWRYHSIYLMLIIMKLQQAYDPTSKNPQLFPGKYVIEPFTTKIFAYFRNNQDHFLPIRKKIKTSIAFWIIWSPLNIYLSCSKITQVNGKTAVETHWAHLLSLEFALSSYYLGEIIYLVSKFPKKWISKFQHQENEGC